MNIHQAALEALINNDIDEKIALTHSVYQQSLKAEIIPHDSLPDIVAMPIPGRPDKPELVSPRQVKQRKLDSELGRATLVHAIVHIEFNAINLALDAAYRFRGMPSSFYQDWLKVAYEESHHFNLLRDRLNKLGYDYGDFPAHNGLWEMTVKTDHDVLVRMALVPRVLEARGLDVTPAMINKLKQVKDQETIDILDIILHDEIGHVAIGSHWFHHCCAQRALDPIKTFRELIDTYMNGQLRGPFNEQARLMAGFSQEELSALPD